jgi:acyl transferase domain-containing protein
MARDTTLDIAVVGMSGRFPGASDLVEWWQAVAEGRVLTTRYHRRCLLDAGVPESLVEDPDYVPVRGHLAGADRFDHTLFRISPREAELLDPQHRLMLEVAWTGLEDAGHDPSGGGPVTAVFASMTGSGYVRSMLRHGPLDPATLDDVIHGTEPDFVASRIAYKLGLTGPAMAVQTACSSSLVAVHLAVQSLLNGDCDQAVVVAAGYAFPQAGHLYLQGGVLSRSGACRPFDERADGVVGGSGVACVVLRRLADAVASGPEPHGVILGTAINNDGSEKAGYYAPSVTGQMAVIRAALEAADVAATTIGYLEAHGTGTRIGDPIEWSAAATVLRELGARPGQVAVGAAKANVGHLDAASGLAGLIKALLVVKTGVVPAVAGFRRANPLLDTDGSPLHVPTGAAPWGGPRPRRAGVSSFGVGGTNAHVVIEQAPGPVAASPAVAGDGPSRLVLLSAADPEALARSATRLAAHLERARPAPGDVAFTLATARAVLDERIAVAGRTSAEVADRLRAGTVVARGRRTAERPARVVVLFPGQGTQHPGMAVPYQRALPGFSSALDRCLEAFDAAVADRLRPALSDVRFPAEELHRTGLAQPALFAVGYAAATALSALGVAPAAVVGHSLGEITAACAGGGIDLPDAARLVTTRGSAMQACPAGAMLALGCEEASARELIADSGLSLEVAAVNGPDACVVAGAVEPVDKFRSWLGDQVFARRLATSHAFHSALIAPALPRLAEAMAGVALHPLRVPLATNLDGHLVPAGTAIAREMFVMQARRPVRFGDAVATLAGRFPGAVVVEVGPGRALSAMVEAAGLSAVPLSPGRTGRPDEEVLAALGTLWSTGQPLVPAALCGGGRPIHLPTYPFRGPRHLAPEATGRPRQGERPARGVAPPPRVGAAAEPAGAVTEPADAVTEPAGAVTEPAGAVTEPAGAVDVFALLTGIWSDLLGRTDLADHSDFFDLGGDSLLITRLARRVRQETGVRVPLPEMLAGRTLGSHVTIVRTLLGAREGTPS